MQSSFKFTKTKQRENRASNTECYLCLGCVPGDDCGDTASPGLVARNTFRIISENFGSNFLCLCR